MSNNKDDGMERLAYQLEKMLLENQDDDLNKNQAIQHWVYFSCQMLQWEAFDPVNKKWMHHLPMINGDSYFARSDKESMGVGTEHLVLGKNVSDQVVFKYSPLTNTWAEGPRMNKPRCLFGSASLGKIAIFAGGVNREGKITNTVESYSSEVGAWETLPSLLKPRKMCFGVFMDGKFFVIGGCGGPDTMPLSCGEEYDPVGYKRISPPLLAVVNNELYAADCSEIKVKKYNKNVKVWERIGKLPERAANRDGWGIAFRGCGDRVIIIAGLQTHGENTHVEIYAWVPKEGPPKLTIVGRKNTITLFTNFVYNCAIMDVEVEI